MDEGPGDTLSFKTFPSLINRLLMATHSSTLTWKIPWKEEHGRLQSMGSRRVGHNRVSSLSLFHFHALEKEMSTHSNVLAWRIPGMEESGGLPCMGSHRVRHDWSDLAAAAWRYKEWTTWMWSKGLSDWISEESPVKFWSQHPGLGEWNGQRWETDKCFQFGSKTFSKQ